MKILCVVVCVLCALVISTFADNPDITKMQRALKEAGYDPGPIDGLMGEKTLEAMRQYKVDVEAGKEKLDDDLHAYVLATLALPGSKEESSNLRRLCKAALSNQLGRPLQIIKVQTDPDGIVRLWYDRPSDGERWDFKCNWGPGNQILVKTKDADWDPKIGWKSYYEIEGDTLTIKTDIDDGSYVKEGKFRLSELD